MAPVSIDVAERQLQTTIQTLYTLLVQIHSFNGPETSAALRTSLNTLVSNLQALLATTPSLAVAVPKEIIAYVEDGRNPDIYTREFVELVQKANQLVKGKAEAFASFRDILAEEIGSAMPEMKGEVEKVLRETGGKDS